MKIFSFGTLLAIVLITLPAIAWADAESPAGQNSSTSPVPDKILCEWLLGNHTNSTDQTLLHGLENAQIYHIQPDLKPEALELFGLQSADRKVMAKVGRSGAEEEHENLGNPNFITFSIANGELRLQRKDGTVTVSFPLPDPARAHYGWFPVSPIGVPESGLVLMDNGSERIVLKVSTSKKMRFFELDLDVNCQRRLSYAGPPRSISNSADAYVVTARGLLCRIKVLHALGLSAPRSP